MKRTTINEPARLDRFVKSWGFQGFGVEDGGVRSEPGKCISSEWGKLEYALWLGKGLEWKKKTGLANHQGQGGGSKARLSKDQQQELKQTLNRKDLWTVGRVRNMVKEQYGVSYGKRQLQRILRQVGLYCYKPQPGDFRQPEKADEKLKERLRAVADELCLKGKDLNKLCWFCRWKFAPNSCCWIAVIRVWSTASTTGSRKVFLSKVDEGQLKAIISERPQSDCSSRERAGCKGAPGDAEAFSKKHLYTFGRLRKSLKSKQDVLI